MSEAYGEFGLHPWELDRYDFKDYVCLRKGRNKRELSEWHRVRLLAYYSAAANLKKGTKITDLFPLPGDKVGKSLKDLKGEELKEWYENRKKMEIEAGIRKE